MPHLPNNGDVTANSLQNPAIGSAIAQVPTSPTGPPPPFPPSSSSAAATTTPVVIRLSHNDLNDAQNISKILQSSFHNGSANSTNHNNNHSSDKRLFADDQLSITKSNHKEDGTKANDEKQHHRSRRKQKATVVTSPATAALTVKQNQYKHTNGLNNSADKILSNCYSLLNGDDAYDDEQIEKWKLENLQTRKLAFKEIRKFGRNYNGLYEQLEKAKGTFDMRLGFIQMCTEEALRFRRNHMATCIQEWWEIKTDEKASEPAERLKI